MTNAVGVVLFGTLYAVAGTGFMSQGGFLACLTVLFALVTTIWVRTEARHRHRDGVARFGRAAFGLAVVLIVTPILVLMPLFWLDTQLPPEAGLRALLAPIMTLVLVSLALVTLANFAGGIVVAGRTLAGWRRPSR